MVELLAIRHNDTNGRPAHHVPVLQALLMVVRAILRRLGLVETRAAHQSSLGEKVMGCLKHRWGHDTPCNCNECYDYRMQQEEKRKQEALYMMAQDFLHMCPEMVSVAVNADALIARYKGYAGSGERPALPWRERPKLV